MSRILFVHPDWEADLRALPGIIKHFVVQETVLPAFVMVTDHRPITMVGQPDAPELFRLTEQPLGLAPFPLTTVALACMPCPQEPNG